MGKKLLMEKVEESDATECKENDVNNEKPSQEINTTDIKEINTMSEM